jgi:hypothetical protein
MFLYFGIDEVAQVRFQPGKGAFLVCAHQPAVTGHIGGKDSGKPALNAIFGHMLPSRLKAAVQQTVVVPPRAVYRGGFPVWVRLGCRVLCKSMSAESPKADIWEQAGKVAEVPKPDRHQWAM